MQRRYSSPALIDYHRPLSKEPAYLRFFSPTDELDYKEFIRLVCSTSSSHFSSHVVNAFKNHEVYKKITRQVEALYDPSLSFYTSLNADFFTTLNSTAVNLPFHRQLFKAYAEILASSAKKRRRQCLEWEKIAVILAFDDLFQMNGALRRDVKKLYSWCNASSDMNDQIAAIQLIEQYVEHFIFFPLRRYLNDQGTHRSSSDFAKSKQRILLALKSKIDLTVPPCAATKKQIKIKPLPQLQQLIDDYSLAKANFINQPINLMQRQLNAIMSTTNFFNPMNNRASMPYLTNFQSTGTINSKKWHWRDGFRLTGSFVIAASLLLLPFPHIALPLALFGVLMVTLTRFGELKLAKMKPGATPHSASFFKPAPPFHLEIKDQKPCLTGKIKPLIT